MDLSKKGSEIPCCSAAISGCSAKFGDRQSNQRSVGKDVSFQPEMGIIIENIDSGLNDVLRI
jgi:hypothetical protein